jgi:hypothetical protein
MPLQKDCCQELVGFCVVYVDANQTTMLHTHHLLMKIRQVLHISSKCLQSAGSALNKIICDGAMWLSCDKHHSLSVLKIKPIIWASSQQEIHLY